MKPFQIADWVVEPDANRMTRGRQRIDLEPRVMELLVRLARAEGAVVSKEELLRDVWDDRVVVEHVVPKSVSSLRRALGESARHPKLIRTVVKRGYQLGCPVVWEVSRPRQRRRRVLESLGTFRKAAVLALLAPLAMIGGSPPGAEVSGMTTDGIRTRVVVKLRWKPAPPTGSYSEGTEWDFDLSVPSPDPLKG